MSYDNNCTNCPYNNQAHLVSPAHITKRANPPIELEDHNSDVLLVFQAPGDIEWSAGLAIQPTKKPGGTAGVRIKKSWERKKKSRSDFNIINAVQCFPGNDGDRDLSPNSMAICSCSKRLKDILNAKTYQKIIAFGRIAEDVVDSLVKTLKYTPNIIKGVHPNGGVTKDELDDLW